MKRTKWFERKFPPITDSGLLPTIIERLRGTTIRLQHILAHADKSMLTEQRESKWSFQEEIGHLGDLEPLWIGRIDDFENRLETLRPADLTNKKTYDAKHNEADVHQLLQTFIESRGEFIDRLMKLSDEQLEHVALHPRLQTPMRVVDLAYFVAEHDDHHIARMRELAMTSQITS